MPPPKAPPLDKLIDVLSRHAAGLGRAELQAELGLKGADPQAFRRLLAPLIAAGQVRVEGATKARRYFAAEPAGLSGSRDSRALRRRLERPLRLRRPVGYRRSFLDGYVPNRTFYLAAKLRERLGGLGRTAVAAQPAGTYARQVLQRLLIDLSWNSSRLEGNTYSLLETERLVSLGEAGSEKDRRETQMILNHKAAIEFLVEGAGTLAVDERLVKNLHALLVDNLLPNPLDAGRVRDTLVGVTGTVFEPLANPQLLSECFSQLVRTAAAIHDAFEQAFFVLAHLPYLQPFIDGNKRTARLAANAGFITQNLVPISFVDVPAADFTHGVLGVYEENDVSLLRDVFTFAYERSALRFGAVVASLGEPDPFRLQHRAHLKAAVAEVVRSNLERDAALAHLDAYASRHLPEPARIRFVAVAQAELDALHPGNYARYQLRPSEFDAWWARRNRLG